MLKTTNILFIATNYELRVDGTWEIQDLGEFILDLIAGNWRPLYRNFKI